MDGEARPGISIVVPLYNEAENLEDLHRQLTAALEPTGRSFELVLVDDGSTDGTRERLLALEARDPRVRAVAPAAQLRPDRGLLGGLRPLARRRGRHLGRGPAERPRRHPAPRRRSSRRTTSTWSAAGGSERQDPLSKRVPSFFANRLISWATGVRLHDYGCSLKAMRGEVARGIRLYGEMHRFIPAVASWMGVSLAEVPVNHRPRTRGQSKYGIGRTVRVLLDLFTVKFLHSYGTRPAHLFGLVGLAFGASGAGHPRLPRRPQDLLRRGDRRAAAAAPRRAALPDRGHPRELRPDGRAARAHLAREPGQADLRGAGAAAGQERGAARGLGPLTRVLFLAESFHPVLGGGETHVRRLGSALVAAGDAATVVTRRGERGVAGRGAARRHPGRAGAARRARAGRASTCMLPAAVRGGAPRGAAATTCSSSAARACSACRASWRRARPASAS